MKRKNEFAEDPSFFRWEIWDVVFSYCGSYKIIQQLIEDQNIEKMDLLRRKWLLQKLRFCLEKSLNTDAVWPLLEQHDAYLTGSMAFHSTFDYKEASWSYNDIDFFISHTNAPRFVQALREVMMRTCKASEPPKVKKTNLRVMQDHSGQEYDDVLCPSNHIHEIYNLQCENRSKFGNLQTIAIDLTEKKKNMPSWIEHSFDLKPLTLCTNGVSIYNYHNLDETHCLINQSLMESRLNPVGVLTKYSQTRIYDRFVKYLKRGFKFVDFELPKYLLVPFVWNEEKKTYHHDGGKKRITHWDQFRVDDMPLVPFLTNNHPVTREKFVIPKEMQSLTSDRLARPGPVFCKDESHPACVALNHSFYHPCGKDVFDIE